MGRFRALQHSRVRRGSELALSECPSLISKNTPAEVKGEELQAGHFARGHLHGRYVWRIIERARWILTSAKSTAVLGPGATATASQ